MGRVLLGLGLHKETARSAPIRYEKPPPKGHSMRSTIDGFGDVLFMSLMIDDCASIIQTDMLTQLSMLLNLILNELLLLFCWAA